MWWCTGVAICNLVKVALFSCLHIHINKHPHTQKHTWSPDTHMRMLRHTHGRTNWQNVEEQNSAQISRGKKKISSRLSTSSLLVSSSLLSSSASSLGLTFTHHLSYFPFTVAWQQTGTASHGDVKTTGRTCRANHRVDVLLRKLHYTLLLFWYLIHYHPLYYV